MSDAFLLCRDCGVVHRVYAAHELAEGGEANEAAAIAYGGFLIEHRHHPLERVERTGVNAHYEGTLWDPVHTSYIELSNGEQAFTVRSGRESIDEPVRHEVVEQRIETAAVRLAIEEHEIRRALDCHFYPYALRPSKVDQFVAAVRAILPLLPADQIATEFDDADDPTLSIARLPDEGVVTLLERSMDIFDAWELSRIAGFISANRDEYGALALRVRRETTLSPQPSRDER
jgi:hypothetical protein